MGQSAPRARLASSAETMQNRMAVRVIGLTGGIASGKSTVAEMLRELGAAIVDADQLAREVVAPGTEAAQEIRTRFGEQVFFANGSLDRKKLGALIFDDAEAREDLGRITHPRIAAASQRAIAKLAATGADPIIYEAALLVENGLHRSLAGLIVVSVPPEAQLQRLMSRDQIGEGEAEKRLASQLPLEEKLAAATWVIDNSRSLEDTRTQVEELWSKLRSHDAQTIADD